MSTRENILKEIYQFNTYYPKRISPLGGRSWNLQLGRPFLGHHNYTISLYEPCISVEKTIFLKENIKFSLFTQN